MRVAWPEGVEAQAVTSGPNPSGARIAISRVDGAVFDIVSFTAKLLANTAATGASIEVMPKRGGEDALNDPIFFFASGVYGNSFSYDRVPGRAGSTHAPVGSDEYVIGLFVDFALTSLVLESAVVPEPGTGVLLLAGVLALGARRARAGSATKST